MKQDVDKKGRFPIIILFTGIIVSVLLALSMGYQVWSDYVSLRKFSTIDLTLQRLVGKIIHIDEVLTMSARMAVSMEDPQWEERYLRFEPELDAAIKEAIALAPEGFEKSGAMQTDEANVKLVNMEHKTFELLKQGERKAAKAILFSDEYEKQKQIYARGMKIITDSMQKRIEDDLKRHKQHVYLTILFAVASTLILISIWSVIMFLIKKYLDERNLIEEELQKHQAHLKEQIEERTHELVNTNKQLNMELAERRRTEDNLRESRGLYRSLVENINLGIAYIDTNYKVIMANHFQGKMLNKQASEFIGKNCFKEFEKRNEVCSHCPGAVAMATRNPAEVDTQGILDDGSSVSVHLRTFPVIGSDGRVNGFIEIVEDITESKKAEDELKKSYYELEETQEASLNIMEDLEINRNELESSLKDKEVLLREIHHRVKNNMQVVSSLLKLQMGSIKDKQFIEMLKDTQSRVTAMSLIHEKLYQSKDLANVNFGDYVKSLVNDLFRSYKVGVNKISLKMNIDTISLGIDIAIPCGLVINELISNCLKYAFPEGRDGELKISLHRIADCGLQNANLKSLPEKRQAGEIELIVSDNGVGIPEDVDYMNTESLGLRLIVNLTEHQLQGKVKLNRDKGTEFKIRFKEILYKKRL